MTNRQELRDQLFHYFHAVSSGENLVQCIKQILFVHERFNPVLLFQKLSKGKQAISLKNWKDYLGSINMHYTQKQFNYFLKNNQYRQEVNLNQFLESMIPYNGDVTRQYKKRCTRLMEVRQLDREVEYIFAQIIQNQFKLFRILINVRSQITKSISSKQSQIQKLVKSDILDHLKGDEPRQYGKQQEAFNKGLKLGYTELRKFLNALKFQPKNGQNKQKINQINILNIMRHLRSDDPFCKIIFKNKKGSKQVNQASTQKPQSIKDSHLMYSNQKLRQARNPQDLGNNSMSNHSRNISSSANRNKYDEFKHNLLNEFNQKKQIYDESHLRPSGYQRQYSNSDKKGQRQLFQNSYLRQRQASMMPNQHNLGHSNKVNRQKQTQHRGGRTILMFFQEIMSKQQKLQDLKKKLAVRNDFNLQNLYKLISNKKQGTIKERDIQQWYPASKGQYSWLVDFYGQQKKGNLYFYEFCQIFRPMSRQLNTTIDNRPQNNNPDPFKDQTKRLISQILRLTAEMHLNLYKIKQTMEGIDRRTIHQFIDIHRNNYLDSQSLRQLFSQNDLPFDNKTLKFLMKFFRKRIQDKISLDELEQYISF